jgi:hypothetical protein
MAWSLLQKTKADNVFIGGTSLGATFPGACTPGSLLVGFVSWGIVSTTLSVSDPTNGSWTAINTNTHANIPSKIGLFYLLNTASTALTVTGASSASASFGNVIWCEFSGNAASSPLDAQSTGALVNTGLTITDASFTTGTDGDLVVSAIGNETAALTAGSGFVIADTNTGSGSGVEWQTQTTHGAIAPSWTQSTNNHAIVISAAFKPAAGGGGSTFRPSGAIIRPSYAVHRAANW